MKHTIVISPSKHYLTREQVNEFRDNILNDEDLHPPGFLVVVEDSFPELQFTVHSHNDTGIESFRQQLAYTCGLWACFVAMKGAYN